MSITSHQPHLVGFFKIFHIIGDPKAEPPIPALIPISRTSWLDGVKSGKYPKSYKLGVRSVAWKIEDIHALISQLGGGL
jgi:predicted DNA-binding transcriptional regulator AlpA